MYYYAFPENPAYHNCGITKISPQTVLLIF
jgi:hypothetical protein